MQKRSIGRAPWLFLPVNRDRLLACTQNYTAQYPSGKKLFLMLLLWRLSAATPQSRKTELVSRNSQKTLKKSCMEEKEKKETTALL